jgi:hypothetical protein
LLSLLLSSHKANDGLDFRRHQVRNGALLPYPPDKIPSCCTKARAETNDAFLSRFGERPFLIFS